MLTRPPADDSRRSRRSKRRLTPQERERLDKEAADKRAYRALIEAGGAPLKSVPVTDINALIEALIDLHWLKESEAEDRKALVVAVGALLDDIAKPYRRPLSGADRQTAKGAPGSRP